MKLAVNSMFLAKLQQTDDEAAIRFPTAQDLGLGSIGLMLSKTLVHGGYLSTPANTIQFASTGGGGTHFSFLLVDGAIDDASPVVLTVPEAIEEENYVLGESLYEFLCFGYLRGFFALEQLGYAESKQEVVDIFCDASWKPRDKHDDWVGFVLSEHQQNLLAFLRQRLGLQPWENPWQRFSSLQEMYARQLTERVQS